MVLDVETTGLDARRDVLLAIAAVALHRDGDRLRLLPVLVVTPIAIPEILMGVSLLIFFVMLNVTLGLVSIILSHVAFCVGFVAIVEPAARGVEPAARGGGDLHQARQLFGLHPVSGQGPQDPDTGLQLAQPGHEGLAAAAQVASTHAAMGADALATGHYVVGKPLGLDTVAAAYGIHQLANEAMASAARWRGSMPTNSAVG